MTGWWWFDSYLLSPRILGRLAAWRIFLGWAITTKTGSSMIVLAVRLGRLFVCLWDSKRQSLTRKAWYVFFDMGLSINGGTSDASKFIATTSRETTAFWGVQVLDKPIVSINIDGLCFNTLHPWRTARYRAVDGYWWKWFQPGMSLYESCIWTLMLILLVDACFQYGCGSTPWHPTKHFLSDQKSLSWDVHLT